jgi:tetratricopeptide (TPR) repeat protein
MGPAWREDVGGLRMVKVAGSFHEMGRQHGALLKNELLDGPVPYFRRFVEKMFGGPGMGRVAWLVLQRGIGVNVARALPDFAVETVRGMAEGAGVPFRDLMSGCTMPDTLMWIVARMMHVRRIGPAVAHRHALGLGCTSAIAWGDATKDGKLLHARNFDYYGVSVWPRTQAVIFHEPEKGQRYASLSAAGVPLGGVTAMNEAGLTLTVHQHMFTDKTRFGGTPIGTVGDIVMREAKNLDDAERILGSHTPIGCWTYLVTDGNAREVLCWEENPDRHVARREKKAGTFGYANIYLDEELGATECDLYGNYWRHNRGRHQAVNARLRERFGSLDPEGMARILGDVGESPCRVRDSIAMMLTVASVVFRPEDGAFWAASGETPTSHGTFVPFDLRGERHAVENGTFKGGESPASFEHYRRAYVAYVDESDPKKALAEMDRARELSPEQSVYHALFGLLAMATGDARAAEQAFETALANGHPDPERQASMHLWHARAHDLEGRRDEAIAEYERVLALRADAPVQRAAEKGLHKRWRAKNIHVEMCFGDVVAP